MHNRQPLLKTPGLHRYGALAALAAILLFASPAAATRRERLELAHSSLELPAAPAAILSADLDGDGRRDLVVALAYTDWDQISIEESTEMDDIDGLVEVMTIVPALFDRRQIQVFRGLAEGGFELLATMPLPSSVLSIEAGPPGWPVIALTDEGLAELRLSDGDGDGGPRLSLEPLIDEPPVLAHTGTFISDLAMTRDLDGDGTADLLLPAIGGPKIYLSAPEERRLSAIAHLSLPPSARTRGTLHYPVPELRDVDGDHLPDLLLPHHRQRWQHFYVLRNLGGGKFTEPLAPLGPPPPDRRRKSAAEDAPRVVFFGDLDADGRAEYVTIEDLSDSEAGLRQELREAKRPPLRVRLHRSRPDLGMISEPYASFAAEGYAFDEEDGRGAIPGGFVDLDGDGRLDLITLTLDFSLFQAVRVLTVRSLSIGLDFHIWCQNADGEFHKVDGLDLSGKFRLNFDNLRLGHLSQFGGDFDGDGKADFVQIGRGRKVTLHRGRQGCRYPNEPDLALELDSPPRDLSLVRVGDLDGDELSDLMIVQPQRTKDAGVTPPVRLDLYLSGRTP